MAGGREIVTKIRSVENTMKVTSALEMVSASKIRKSQDLMKESRPYAHMMHRVIGHLGKANPEYRHPFTVKHPDVKRVGYVVISSDRGLCGGLNNNLFKEMLADMGEWQAKGAEVSLVALGKKALAYFKNVKVEVTAAASDFGENPQIEDLIGVIRPLLEEYRDRKVDRVYLVHNEFINTMVQNTDRR